jgi:hypothetical protein
VRTRFVQCGSHEILSKPNEPTTIADWLHHFNVHAKGFFRSTAATPSDKNIQKWPLLQDSRQRSHG